MVEGVLVMTHESRLSAASAVAAADVTTTDEALTRAEADLKGGGRILEWAAVTHPGLEDAARLAFAAARRARLARLRRAA